MRGFHPIASTAAALHYKAGTAPLSVFMSVAACAAVLLLFLAVVASPKFAASKLANALVILAAIPAILLCLLGALGIVVGWLDWAFALDCIRGNPEYPCPSLLQAFVGTALDVALLGSPAVIVWLTTRRLKNWR